MTAEEKIFAILSTAATVIALVPANRIKVPSDMQSVEAPYIVHFPVGVETYQTHAGLLPMRSWASYQVSVYAASYAEARTISEAVRVALDGYKDAAVNQLIYARTVGVGFDADIGLAHVACDFDLSGAVS